MRCYYTLECNNLVAIQQQTLDYINYQTDLLTHPQGQYWNKTNTKNFVRHNPALIEYCNSLQLKIQEVAVLITRKPGLSLPLHIDELPVVAKINFPILNTQDTWTAWYDIPQSILDQLGKEKNMFGSDFYNLSKLDTANFSKLAEIEITKPVVFNSQIAHQVTVGTAAQLPRIVLACMFFNQPIHYLQ
jgi:hypothetical protein